MHTRRFAVVSTGSIVAATALSLIGWLAAESEAASRAAPQVTPIPSDMPSSKAALLQRQDARRLAAASNPVVDPTNTDSSASYEAGILPLRQGPYPVGTFDATNLWNGPIGGTWLFVQAGGVRQNAATAASDSNDVASVFVWIKNIDPSAMAAADIVGAIAAPGSPSGELNAVSEENGILTLSLVGSNSTYRFDLSVQKFLQ